MLFFPPLQEEEEESGEEDGEGGDLEGEGEGEGVVEPADEGCHEGESEADDEVADGEDGGAHFGEGLAVDVAFEDGSGEAADDVEEEEDGEGGVGQAEGDGEVAADDEEEDERVGLVFSQAGAEGVRVEGGDADDEVEDGPHDAEELGGEVDVHEDRLHEPCHGKGGGADDAREEDVVAEGAVADEGVVEDVQDVAQGVEDAGAGVVFLEGEGGGDADEGDAHLAVERQAEEGGGEQSAADAGKGFGEVADHDDPSFVFEVVFLAPVAEHGVVEEGGVGAGDEALSDAQQDFREEEGAEGVGEGIGDGSPEGDEAAGEQAFLASPGVGEVAGGDVQSNGDDGVDAFEEEDFFQAQSVFLVEKHDDGHDQGEPFGDLDAVERRDISLECAHLCVRLQGQR